MLYFLCKIDGGNILKNKVAKNKISQMQNETQEVLDNIILDALMEIKYRNNIDEHMLERILLVHLSFFGTKNFFEYDELNEYEKYIICKIIWNGVVSIFVDDEYFYLRKSNSKSTIIDEITEILCVLLNCNRNTIKKLIEIDIKSYM